MLMDVTTNAFLIINVLRRTTRGCSKAARNRAYIALVYSASDCGHMTITMMLQMATVRQ